MSRDRESRYNQIDAALWEAVKETIEPLRRPSMKKSEPDDRSAPVVRSKKTKLLRTAAPPLISHAAAVPPLAKLDRRTRQKVARGRVEIDGRIDLHGMRQEEAREELSRFLHRAQARGQSLVLVITGKGTSAAVGAERGALRRAVPLWLAMPALRPLVIGFEEAAPAHGGAGALYVRIRKSR
jgi:DNA-nicking Smr family endonuclease